MSTPQDVGTEAGLTEQERALWFAWKRAHEVVRARMAEDVRAATGLSDPDVAILVRIADEDGPVRQNLLASLLGWDRTRLSHHLSRMEERGLIARGKVAAGVEIELTRAGRDIVALAQPVHAAAVRRHLVDPFTAEQLAHLREVLDRISAP